MIKIFTPNKNGKIEFTKLELENLLDEVWRDGYNSKYNWTWRSPWYSPWCYGGTVYCDTTDTTTDKWTTTICQNDEINVTGDSIKLNIGE